MAKTRVGDIETFDAFTNWTNYVGGGFSAAGGVAVPGTDGVDNGARITSATGWTQDVYAQATISTAPSGGDEIGVTVRDDGWNATQHGYIATTDCASYHAIIRYTAGVYAEIHTDTTSGLFQAGDIIEIQAIGVNPTVLTVYRTRSTVRTTAMTHTDPTETDLPGNATDSAGIHSWGNSGRLDDWEGGVVTADAGTVIPVFMYHYKQQRKR